jgi:maleate isomerase
MSGTVHHEQMSTVAGGSVAPRETSWTVPTGLTPDPVDGPLPTVGVGVVTPYDFALDRELWRWAPPAATLHLTRTPYAPLPVSLEQATVVGEPEIVARCTTELMAAEPKVVAYSCTSGSFINRRAGERALVASMIAVGAPQAVTTSGALVEALRHLGAQKIAVATPYDGTVSRGLGAFLEEAGLAVTRMRRLGLEGHIWTVPYAVTLDLVRRAYSPDCDAVFISCTNLPTYDIIAPLETELGVPVLTASQVTMWAALRAVGLAAVGPGQRLLEPVDPEARDQPAGDSAVSADRSRAPLAPAPGAPPAPSPAPLFGARP